jgi:enoyl-[acyl-carrier protein] reductase II
MGTRFMNSKESPVHEDQKVATNNNDIDNTVYTNKVDGLFARVMKSKGSKKLMSKRLNPFSALIQSKKIAKLLGFPWLKLAIGITFMGFKKSMQMARMAIGFEAFQVGTSDGDNKKGVLPIGQAAGLIHETLTVQEIMDQIMKDAKKSYDELGEKIMRAGR